MYALIAVVVGIFAMMMGYRRGFIAQIPQLIGMTIGIVCAHIFLYPGEELLREVCPQFKNMLASDYIYSVMTTGLIYLVVFFVFSKVSSFISLAMKMISLGILNKVFGTFVSLLRYMLLLSVIFNFILAWRNDEELIKLATCNDGNLVVGIVSLQSLLLGGDSVDDLSLTLQLHAAKSIS